MAKTFSPDDESTVEEKEAILLQAVKNPEFDWYHHDFTVKFLPVLDVLPFEETIKNSDFRKQNYYVEHKEDQRTLLTRFGTIEIKRAYYVPKIGGKGVYLLDKYIGIDRKSI